MSTDDRARLPIIATLIAVLAIIHSVLSLAFLVGILAWVSTRVGGMNLHQEHQVVGALLGAWVFDGVPNVVLIAASVGVLRRSKIAMNVFLLVLVYRIIRPVVLHAVVLIGAVDSTRLQEQVLPASYTHAVIAFVVVLILSFSSATYKCFYPEECIASSMQSDEHSEAEPDRARAHPRLCEHCRSLLPLADRHTTHVRCPSCEKLSAVRRA